MKNSQKKIAVFAGSFDPFTIGHLDLVKRACELFDFIWIVVAINASKKCLFSENMRMQLAQTSLSSLSIKNRKKVRVTSYCGLIVNFMENIGANFIVRGVRSVVDTDYEMQMAINNRTLKPDCETVFLPSLPEYASISSTAVREILKCSSDTQKQSEILKNFIPKMAVNEVITDFNSLQKGSI